MKPNLRHLPRHMLATAAVLIASGTPTLATAADAAKANNMFGISLMQRSSAGKDNFVFSPFSIWSVLAMTSAGAEKETLAQMRKVLGLPEDDAAHAIAGEWSRRLMKPAPNVEMQMASRLWGEKTLSFKETFLKSTQKHYAAGLEELDFKGSPDGSRKRINAWVAGETKDRIKNLLQPVHIQSDTKLVLTNAVYFKADWASPFNARLTSVHPFNKADGRTVNVMMMGGGFNGLRYMENGSFQAIQMGYAGGGCSMVVVLPRKADALAQSGFMTSAKFSSVLTSLKPERKVLVNLPRFEVSARLDLKSTLTDMGMERAFSTEAEFGGMCEEPLKISTVVHEAWVKVAEKGTEAAAATAVIMVPRGAAPNSEPSRTFMADHPFLFFIVDDASGTVLFAGKVMEPELAK